MIMKCTCLTSLFFKDVTVQKSHAFYGNTTYITSLRKYTQQVSEYTQLSSLTALKFTSLTTHTKCGKQCFLYFSPVTSDYEHVKEKIKYKK